MKNNQETIAVDNKMPAFHPSRKRHYLIKQMKNSWRLYVLFILPLLWVAVFKYIPILGVQIAFREYNITDGIYNSPFVGLKYFEKFLVNPKFWTVLINTFRISIYSLLVTFPMNILLALSFNCVLNKRFQKFAQMVTYLPHFISVVVLIGIVNQMFSYQTGVINNILASIAGHRVNFLGNPDYFSTFYVWSGVWQNTGWNSIIFIAALAGIDPNLHEAATIDGANRIKRIYYVDIPGILPTAMIVLIMNFGHIMTTGFEKIILMQNPLNLEVSEVIDSYVYKMGLASQIPNYSYSTAVGLMQSVVTLVLLTIVNKVSKVITETSLW